MKDCYTATKDDCGALLACLTLLLAHGRLSFSKALRELSATFVYDSETIQMLHFKKQRKLKLYHHFNAANLVQACAPASVVPKFILL